MSMARPTCFCYMSDCGVCNPKAAAATCFCHLPECVICGQGPGSPNSDVQRWLREEKEQCLYKVGSRGHGYTGACKELVWNASRMLPVLLQTGIITEGPNWSCERNVISRLLHVPERSVQAIQAEGETLRVAGGVRFPDPLPTGRRKKESEATETEAAFSGENEATNPTEADDRMIALCLGRAALGVLIHNQTEMAYTRQIVQMFRANVPVGHFHHAPCRQIDYCLTWAWAASISLRVLSAGSSLCSLAGLCSGGCSDSNESIMACCDAKP